jgi:periplasmic glucans biosynthesis protein
LSRSLIRRRVFVRSLAAGAALAPLALSPARAFAKPTGLRFGQPFAFSFDGLIERARKLATAPYKEPYRPAPDIVSRIDYEVHGKIHWKTSAALFGDLPAGYPVTFFHLGQFFQKSVKMHELRAGQAREILYSPEYFDMPADSIARKLPKDSGFAGFRLQEDKARADWKTHDWLAFLGASYFRAIGALEQYGLSARGIAVNTTVPGTPEEFPDFVEFYLEPALNEHEPVIVYALLDGPSICGAFRFACQRGTGVLMDVDSALFTRKDIAQLGITPLTSMYWFSENDRAYRVDWRPEVHDSDGLALWNGKGERIFRPLNDPTRVVTSSFYDKSPKGFGLLQRDRDYEHYLDGVNYDKRPSLWVEPIGDWGEGAVQLVEIPTDDEIHDNIVAFWVPAAPAKAGSALRYRYRLHWLADEPYPATNVARVFATRIGRGGEPGKARPKGVVKFVVEFAGKPIDTLPTSEKLTAKITASRGAVSYMFVEPVGTTKRWRAQFDVTPEGKEPVELRMYLCNAKQTLSETWLYQLEPRSS